MQAQIGLHGVVIVEAVRNLDDANPLGFEKAHGAQQEVSAWHEVGVEHRHERRVGDRQPVIDIAGLRAFIVRPVDVASPLGHAQVAYPGSPTIVQHPYARVRPVEGETAEDGFFQHFARFIIGGYENIHRG